MGTWLLCLAIIRAIAQVRFRCQCSALGTTLTALSRQQHCHNSVATPPLQKYRQHDPRARHSQPNLCWKNTASTSACHVYLAKKASVPTQRSCDGTKITIEAVLSQQDCCNTTASIVNWMQSGIYASAPSQAPIKQPPIAQSIPFHANVLLA